MTHRLDAQKKPRSWSDSGADKLDAVQIIHSQAGDEQPPSTCYDKTRLASYLGVSVRSLDRANAAGLLPCPDLVVGRSPRWSPQTVQKWLRSRFRRVKPCSAAHNAVGLAGESPVVGIDCLPT